MSAKYFIVNKIFKNEALFGLWLPQFINFHSQCAWLSGFHSVHSNSLTCLMLHHSMFSVDLCFVIIQKLMLVLTFVTFLTLIR